jgi:hypothetical protein
MNNRSLNGGNSTKSLGLDKRKNPLKDVFKTVITPEEIKDLFIMLYKKAIEEKDINATKIILQYCIGMPTQMIVQENINYKEEELSEAEIKRIKNEVDETY